MSSLEDDKLYLRVEDRSGTGFDSETVRAWQYSADREISEIGRWELQTTREAAQDVAAIFDSNEIERQNARGIAYLGDETTEERRLAHGPLDIVEVRRIRADWRFGDWALWLSEAEPFESPPSGDTIADDIASQTAIGLNTTDPQTEPLDKTFSHPTPWRYLREATVQQGLEFRFTDDAPSNGLAIHERGDMGVEHAEEISHERETIAGRPSIDRGEEVSALAVVGDDDPDTADERFFKSDLLSTADPNADRQLYYNEWDFGLQSQSEVEAVWDQLAEELEAAPEQVDIEATLVDLSERPRLGDTFTVDLPERGIEEESFRVIRAGHRLDEGEERFPVLLSNRVLVRPDDERDERRANQSVLDATS